MIRHVTAQTGKDIKPPGSRDSRHPEFKPIAYNTLKFSLTLVEAIAGCFPVPGVKGAIGSLNLVIDRFDVGGSCMMRETLLNNYIYFRKRDKMLPRWMFFLQPLIRWRVFCKAFTRQSHPWEMT